MQVFVPKMIRRDAKVMNFLTAFDGSAWQLSLEFNVPIEEAKLFQEAYFKAYPGLKRFIAQQKAIAYDKREVVCWSGRKRRLDAMYASDWRVQKEGEKEAVNTPVQGGAGDVVKIAMNELHYKYNAPMVLQVHDELVLEVPAKDALEYGHWLKGYMPNITVLGGVNFPVDVGIADTWKDAKSKENTI
jgi:DNA polymerase-1